MLKIVKHSINVRKYFLLQIPSVSGNDGGNYTCSPQNILSDTVMVNIMEVMITINNEIHISE